MTDKISDSPAPDIVLSGQCGPNVFFELDSEGTTTIFGSGDMDDGEDGSPLGQDERVKTAVIKEGVTSVAPDFFDDCFELTNVILPEGLTSIGHGAFWGCGLLSRINLPSTLKTIGYSAFMGCVHLSDIVFPPGLEKIGKSAFAGCESFRHVVLQEGVTDLGQNAFYGCRGLVFAVLPQSITNFGTRVFAGCENLRAVLLPDIADEAAILADGVFARCPSLGVHRYAPQVTAPEDERVRSENIAKELDLFYKLSNDKNAV